MESIDATYVNMRRFDVGGQFAYRARITYDAGQESACMA